MPKSKEPKILIGLGGIGGNIKHQLSKQQTKVINTPFFIDINTNDQSDSLDENAISNIMIGLGGLGGKIVYQLCEQLPKENTYPFYIDTDVSDLSIYPIEQRIHLADSSCLGSGQIRENGYHHFMKASQDHKFQSFYAQINHIICNTKNKVRIYIITSLVGGSGSGFFLSFAQELKNYLFKYTSLPCHLYGEFVLPTYFHKMISHSLNQRIRIEANAYASLKDMVDIEEIHVKNICLIQ